MADFKKLGRAVLDIEIDALVNLRDQLGDDFNQACQLMLTCQARIVVLGMGKSGHIGGKFAATLASTGSPAFFVHPGEASHGDLGMITKRDVVVAISNSGETGEITAILPVIKRLGVSLIAITGNRQSTLAKNADVVLELKIEKEACPLNLAPTASTTATLALGDALAIALLDARGFTAEDFALSHPGGSLGRRLLLKVSDVMHRQDELPKVAPDAIISDALLEMTNKRLGMTTVVDAQGKLVGIYTDGDLRRTLDKNVDFHKATINEVMSKDPKTIEADHLAAEAVKIMQDNAINALIIVDEENRPVGALNMHDLLKAGVV